MIGLRCNLPAISIEPADIFESKFHLTFPMDQVTCQILVAFYIRIYGLDIRHTTPVTHGIPIAQYLVVQLTQLNLCFHIIQ